MRNGQLSHILLTGLFIDEHLARNAIATNGQVQSQAQLTDALGSVIALANAQTSSINTRYSYSPYGQTQATGETSSNNQQYTGREAGVEGEAGLYYYRARYYDPVLKRFISEDPIGLSGGLNVYQYVEGMPSMATDPSGNCPWCFGAVVGGLVGGGFNLYTQLEGDKPFDWTNLVVATGSGLIGGATGAWLGTMTKTLGELWLMNTVFGGSINMMTGVTSKLLDGCVGWADDAGKDFLVGAAFGGLGGVTGEFFGLKAKRFQAWMNLQGALTYSPASQNWQPVLTGVGDVGGAYVGGSNVLFGY